MSTVILASASAQRKALMSALNVPFEVHAADIDEKAIRDKDLGSRVENIARAKAEAIAKDYPNAIIIAGDSFSVAGGHILEKPANLEDAKKMLALLSDKTSFNHNGFCYLDPKNGIDFSTNIVVEFTVRPLSKVEIDGYVTKFPVTTWAGAYSPAYPYGATMFTNVRGSLTGFTHGLPMELVIEYLRKSGIEPTP